MPNKAQAAQRRQPKEPTATATMLCRGLPPAHKKRRGHTPVHKKRRGHTTRPQKAAQAYAVFLKGGFYVTGIL